MANLKMVKGGRYKEDSNTPDYMFILFLLALNLVLICGCWMFKYCFEAISHSPQSMIEAGNKAFIGVSIALFSIVGIALGKEMSDSSNKHTSRLGTAIFCWFFGLAIYGAYYMTFK